MTTRSVAIFGNSDDESFADAVASDSAPLDTIADEMIERYHSE